MSGAGFAFLVLPSISAVMIGWVARHWTLGAAALAGGVGWLYLAPLLPGEARFLTPVFTGAGVAGLVLIPALLWRGDMSVWSRMTLTLATVLMAHFIFLQAVLAQIP